MGDQREQDLLAAAADEVVARITWADLARVVRRRKRSGAGVPGPRRTDPAGLPPVCPLWEPGTSRPAHRASGLGV